MAQGSRQVQTQAQQQVQTLSPQQILVVKLLELPTVELEERIHSEILDNPALEEGRETPENGEESTDFEGNEDNNDNSNPTMTFHWEIIVPRMTSPTINCRNTTAAAKE